MTVTNCGAARFWFRRVIFWVLVIGSKVSLEKKKPRCLNSNDM